MPHIKPDHLEPQRGTGYHGSFLGIADGAVSANDLVVPSGYSGQQVKWRTAIADNAAKRLGVMAIADHAAADGDTVRIVSHKLLTSVDTSGATLGHAAYLTDAAGTWGGTAGTVTIVVGTILVVGASAGAVLLSPSHSVGVE